MKIWFNTSFSSEPRANDCTSPSHSPAYTIPPLTADKMATLHTSLLVHAPTLYIQACSPERWLVCDPPGSGRLAVFDTQALTLLRLFETPLSILQATQMMAHQSSENIEAAVMLFYRSGFLRDTAQPLSVPEEETSDELTAWLHVTNACNLRCHYCYVQKSKENMTADTGYQAINAIFRSAIKHQYRAIYLKYAGGEASLHMARVMELHDYAAQLAQENGLVLKATLLSNGIALTQRTIASLKERHIAVTISLDGLGDTHDSQRPLLNGKGSSRLVLRTIERLLTHEIVPSLTVTLSRRTLVGLPELMQYILKQELPFCINYYRENEFSAHIDDLRFTDEQIIAAMRSVFALIEENLPARSLLDSLLDKVDITSTHQRTCGVGQNYLAIDQHGGIAKCQMEIGRTITTVQTDDPLGIVRVDHKGLQVLRADEKEGCRACEWRNWCTGGCAAMTYRATGRYDVKSPNCNIYKTLFPAVLRLEALRLLEYEEPLVLS